MEDIVAIESGGFMSRGRTGIIYSRDALYSSEICKGQAIPYSEIARVQMYGDDICFIMNDGTKKQICFGRYQEQVFQMINYIIAEQ